MPLNTESPNLSDPYIAIDLFCGCGGVTLGLKRAGFKVIAAIDSDSLAIKSFRKNHPKVIAYQEDISKLNISKFMSDIDLPKGRLDLLAGCPPCQGFSTIRTLNGQKMIDDRRNSLVAAFIKFVKEIEPNCVLFENVPGLTTDRRFNRFWVPGRSLIY